MKMFREKGPEFNLNSLPWPQFKSCVSGFLLTGGNHKLIRIYSENRGVRTMKRFVQVFMTLIIFGFQTTLFADLLINEFMASNIHAQISPDYSDFTDWIELYNSGDDPISLDGIYITDNFDQPSKFGLPPGAIIESRSFYVVWADGLDHDNHASFKLSESGEEIGLYRADGSQIDQVTFGNQMDNVSYGRYPDGGNSWQYFAIPTCGESNADQGVSSAQRAARPGFSPEGGLFSGGQTVTLSSEKGATIRYTLDGSYPSEQSTLYTKPIQMDTTTVIRARAFLDHYLPSKSVTHTYVIDDPTTLPVICISTPPDFLFDDEIGITVGIPVDDALGAPPPFDADANFWQKWERPVYIEYYENDGDQGFAQEAGIKIFGGMFGRQIRQKAFTLFARDKYNDSDFDYPLFSQKSIQSCKRFILRASSNDFNRTFIRDAMMNTLVAGQMDVDWQAYEPAVVYLNGVFWGLYNIREKTNHFYPESNYGIDSDDVDLIEGEDTVAHGDGTQFENMMTFVRGHDLSDSSHYAYVKNLIDLDEFMNYFITQIYVRNHDWLHQNIKCWREHSSTGKWRWLLYDMDWGFGGEIHEGERQYETNSIDWALKQGDASLLFQKLSCNTQFKQEFAQRFATHLNLTFHPQRVHQIIDKMVEKIEPEMDRQIERWGAIPDQDYWHQQLQILHDFGEQRADYVFQHIEESFGYSTVQFAAEVSDSSAGSIAVHDVTFPTPFLEGRWLKNIPLRLKAYPKPGWKFVRWEGPFQGTSDTLTICLSEPALMRAVFAKHDEPVLVISEIHYNPSSSKQGDDDLYEFVELVNAGSATVDLSGYYFADGFSFTFPSNASIQSGEVILLAHTASTYSDLSCRVYEIESGSLANEGERLRLMNSNGEVVDSLTYDDHSPWPASADGDGPSLELTDLSLDNSLAASWKASGETGGTPGKLPSTMVESPANAPLTFQLGPAVPNPFNSRTFFTFELTKSAPTQVVIYNLRGEWIEMLLDRPMQAGNYTLFWDAKDQPSGVYFIRLVSGVLHQTRKCLLIN